MFCSTDAEMTAHSVADECYLIAFQIGLGGFLEESLRLLLHAKHSH